MSSSRRRWPTIALVIAAAAGCLALGWWQWTRYESTSGSFQNLGYALQWPFFAGFVLYAYRKFVRLEQEPEQQVSDELTEIPDGLLPQRPSAAPTTDDPEMQTYNAYLSALAEQHSPDTEHQDRTST